MVNERGPGVNRPSGSDPAYANRVTVSHQQTRATLPVALAFVLAAAIAAVIGAETWLPLHLFLAGGLTLIVSATTLMLTVTWSAAPAPPTRLVAAQRGAIALGAAGIAVARETDLARWVMGCFGVLFVAGLVLLVVLLVHTARRGLERRFDVAVAYYVAALTSAISAVGVGVHMAVSGATVDLRGIHVTLNLLGFVGLTLAGTLPFFAATVGRSRMARSVTPKRLAMLLGAFVLALAATATGLAIGADGLVFAGLGGYAYGIVAVYCFLPRWSRRQLDWSGPRLVALWTGGLWWIGAVAATMHGVVSRDEGVFPDRWLLVLVVGAYAQVLWGSLAYLIPMLRGGGPSKLSEGFDRTRSWVGLVTINAAALAFALDRPDAGLAALVLTVLDGIWRTLRVGLRRATRHEDAPVASGAPGAPARS